ncbi:(Trans)glycosidase [Glarea lozoyensis ATCC 20868]|uniref:Beta-xylanase n=1 Tax=Glarea lozoyensis (strain ATCC 20868 / MF5171) TaxID=1116229 RepID=S3DYG5_GLAL2|nr:(Trans)glycosidase [Glarea lozoyensis ATCC 20868]EPE36981.1 (Trans)glycosidase [Glarea lozoyensis ATCC 20868]
MIAKGKNWFGAALTIRNPVDAQERAIVDNYADFGSITPENAMKWESTEPSRGVFTFDGADAIRDYAATQKKQIHCHNLVWHSQLPLWVSQGKFDNATLISIMYDHIKAVAGRYKGSCTRWDVVNEALNEDGTYRSSVFYDTIGESFIPLAFKFASEIDPNAKLYYNDYNLEYNNAKTDAAARIVALVKSHGVKIQGVGFQAHLTSESTPTSAAVTPDQGVLEAALKKMTVQGVNVAYTELDVRMNTPVTPAKQAAQAEAYARVVRSCMAVEKCEGITIWGITDKYSWIPGVFIGEGSALVWDENYKPKPAYFAMLKAIQESPNPRGCSADNCLRALRSTSVSGRLAESQEFCASYYTQYIVTDITLIKPYAASACGGDIVSRVSSACSCLPKATAT